MKTLIVSVRKLLNNDTRNTVFSGKLGPEEDDAQDLNGILKPHQFPFPYGIIPYKLDTETIGISNIPVIAAGIFMIEQLSCVRFIHMKVPPAGGVSWLHITNPNRVNDCYHKAKDGAVGEKIVTLGYSCFGPHHVARLLLNGMGLAYENNRAGRDEFVAINWNNILPDKRHLFRVDQESISFAGTQYDPKSILHFPSRQFSGNGRPTLSVHGLESEIGENIKLSDIDKVKLRLYFGSECGNREVNEIYNTCMRLRNPNV